MSKTVNFTSIFLYCCILLAPLTVFANEIGTYPKLSNIIIRSNHEYAKHIESAIENADYIQLENSAKFRSLAQNNFPLDFFSNYEAEKLADDAFITAVRKIVRQFTCAEFRYRKNLPEKTACNGYVSNNQNKEKMPFVDGQFKDNRLQAFVDDKIAGYSFELFLESSNSVPLSELFSSVKQIGTFFGQVFDSNELILAVRMSAYRLNEDGYRAQSPINENALIYLIVIPSSKEIAKKKNAHLAGKFAVNKARMLILP